MNVVVCGADGRMGRAILEALVQEKGLTLGAVLEIGTDIKEGLSKGDVVIDFTTTVATLAILEEAVFQKRPIVIGTTGFTEAEKENIARASKEIAIVFSPNMSIGVNVVFKLLADAMRALGSAYDAEIVEMHHRHKKDAPSGTALRMGEAIAQARETTLDEVARFERHGDIGARSLGEIGIQSLRGGDVVGDHRVIFAGPGERIEITHQAHSRENFARGSLIAARWIVNQKPGLYDMMDVLDLK
jgi:4-hydroxy-tetrahydrodipicolinate reductase